MKNKLNTLTIDKNIKLTALRQEVLNILLSKNAPMGAYDILSGLKKKRASAEPTTVYRVLEFLIDAKLIHRIESQNTYVCCSHMQEGAKAHQALLLFCNNCQKSFEYVDESIFAAINKFTKKNKLKIDDTLIEMKGICKGCTAKYHE